MSSFFGKIESREDLVKFLKAAVAGDWYALYPCINGVEVPYHDLEYNEDILVWLQPEKPIRFPVHLLDKAADFIYYLLTEGKWYKQSLVQEALWDEQEEKEEEHLDLGELLKKKLDSCSEEN